VTEKGLMAAMTYYVALAFKRSEDNGEVVACDPKEARSAEHAIRTASGANLTLGTAESAGQNGRNRTRRRP
jgi:hypothetical protein